MDVDVRFVSTPRGRVAFATMGQGDRDYLLAPAGGMHLDVLLDIMGDGTSYPQVAEHARVIFMDRRGSGCSDPLSGPRTPDDAVDDMVSVLDAAGAQHAIVNGYGASGATAIMFAARHGERCAGLILEQSFARLAWAPDFPGGLGQEKQAALLDQAERTWGTGAFMAYLAGVDVDNVDVDRLAVFARRERIIGSPAYARAVRAETLTIDVRDVLSNVRVPTVIFHADSAFVPLWHGRYLAERIPGSELIEVPSGSDWWWNQDSAARARWEEFITGVPARTEPTRRLATVLFTDVVGSTSAAIDRGDAEWRSTLTRLHQHAEREAQLTNGRVIKSTGDGVLATFESPGDAIRVASALHRAAADVGLQMRAGVHVGEVELVGDDVAGIAVHIAARVMDAAPPGATLVSTAVPHLVYGSPLAFTDVGDRTLKGIPQQMRLYEVVDSLSPGVR